MLLHLQCVVHLQILDMVRSELHTIQLSTCATPDTSSRETYGGFARMVNGQEKSRTVEEVRANVCIVAV